MKVREICSFGVVTCHPETSALDVARQMRDRHVGAVVVVESRQGGVVPVGIVTDRDLAIQVMAKALDPSSIRAGDLVARECVTVMDSDLAYEAIWQMRRGSVRRLPVVDARDHLVGIVAMDDLNQFLAQELKDTACIAEHQVTVEKSRMG